MAGGKFSGTLLIAVVCVFSTEGLRFGLPSLPTPSLPSLPSPSIPKVEIPSIPNIPTPVIPELEIPTPSLPQIDLPSPSLPTPSLPSPSRPSLSWPSLPSINVPTPSLPSINLPTPSLPSLPNIPTPDISALTSLVKSPFGKDSKGRCSFSGTTATCCLNVGLKNTRFNARTCGILRFEITSLKLVAAVTVNDKELLSKNIAQADRVCVPLPPPATALQGCFSIYYLDINPLQRSIEACVAVSVNNIIRVQFDCIKFADGKLSITGGRTPDDSAFINLSVNKGRPSVSLSKPQLSQFAPSWLVG